MAQLNAAEYKKKVLGPWSKDDTKKNMLRQVLADLEGDASARGRADQVDLAELFLLPSGQLSPADLKEHARQLEMAYNKASIFPAADLLKRIKAQLSASGDFEDPQFWAERGARQGENRSKALAAAVKELAVATPLGAMSLSETLRRLAALGIHDAEPAAVRQTAQQAGLLVFEDFEPPEESAMKPVRQTWKKVESEHRSVFDLVMLHSGQQTSDRFRFIDELSTDGQPITLADVKKSHARSLSASDSEAIQNAQKYLGSLQKVGGDHELHQVVFRTMWQTTETLLSQGLPATSVLDRLKHAQVAEEDALRVVAAAASQAGGPSRTVGSDAVRERLSDGDLAGARNTLEALKQYPSTAQERAQLAEQIEQREKRKAQAMNAFRTAVQNDDHVAAELALQEAMQCDAADESLAALRLQLPVRSPRVDVREMPSGVRISWTSADPSLRFTVRRGVRGNATTSLLAQDIDANSCEDRDPPVGEFVTYTVTASRPGSPTSDPGQAEILVAAPVHEFRVLSSDESSVSLAWKAHPNAVSVAVEMLDPEGNRSSAQVSGQSTHRVSGLQMGSTYRFSVRAVYLTADGRRESPDATITATPRSKARPVMDLALEPANDDADAFTAVWTAIPGFRVDLWALERTAQPAVGQTMTESALRSAGGRPLTVSIHSQEKGSVTAQFQGLDAVSLVCPVVVTDEGLLVGAPVLSGRAPSVRNLRAEEFADHVMLTWDWPQGDVLVEVRWRTSAGMRTRRVTRARYRLDGAVHLANPQDVTDIDVATVIRAADEEWMGRRVPVPLPETTRRPEIAWDLKITKHFGGGRRVSGTLQCDRPVVAEIGLFLSRDASLPLRSDRCELLERLPADFTSSRTNSFTVELGRIRPPFWVRAFPLDPRTVQLIDPPTSRMEG